MARSSVHQTLSGEMVAPGPGLAAAGPVLLAVLVLEKNTLHLGDHRSICLLFLNNSEHNLENERGSQEPTAARCWPKRIELIVGAGEG